MLLRAIPLLLTITLLQYCAHASHCERSCYVTVESEYGKIRGMRRDADGYEYYSFRNIPYAKQPLGKLRFQELTPPEPWSGIIDTIEDGPICIQNDVFYKTLMQPHGMSEACIHANVHVPLSAPIKIQSKSHCRPSRHLTPPKAHIDANQCALPILIFIHGGGFTFGSGDADIHGPETIVKRDVILVTFNYRLSSFGFLSTNSSQIPGNAGLRDVVTLIKWVKRNARTFGGNPDDITLGGQSAGATIAHIVSMFDKQANKLFKRVIQMSGTASRTFFTTSPANAASMATYLFTRLNITATDPQQIYDILTDTPAEDIFSITKEIQHMTGLIDFTPVIEDEHDDVDAFLPVDADDAINDGEYTPMPRLIGMADNECYSMKHLFEKIDIISRIKENPLTVVPVTLLFKLSPTQLVEVAQQIMARYFKGEPTIDEYINLCSDTFFVYPTLNTVEKTEGDVYLYRFTYIGGGSLILQNATGSLCDAELGCNGVMHVEDLLYLMKTNSYADFPFTPQDISMQDWFQTMITNFVKTGNPTQTNGAFSKWKPVRKGNIQYLDIRKPKDYQMVELSKELLETKYFFDRLYNLKRKD